MTQARAKYNVIGIHGCVSPCREGGNRGPGCGLWCFPYRWLDCSRKFLWFADDEDAAYCSNVSRSLDARIAGRALLARISWWLDSQARQWSIHSSLFQFPTVLPAGWPYKSSSTSPPSQSKSPAASSPYTHAASKPLSYSSSPWRTASPAYHAMRSPYWSVQGLYG